MNNDWNHQSRKRVLIYFITSAIIFVICAFGGAWVSYHYPWAQWPSILVGIVFGLNVFFSMLTYLFAVNE